MSEYLTKEEIRQWRSSLERITLEEFAARLGKTINEEKETSDIVDMVLEKEPVLVNESYKMRTEKINNIAKKALAREREITIVKSPLSKNKNQNLERPIIDNIEETTAKTKKGGKKAPIEIKVETSKKSSQVSVTFSKPLTDREKLVYNHFLANKGSIVYAKDLAELLNLPKDYVYKYIKNLRNKIVEDKLENADNGGYILNI